MLMAQLTLVNINIIMHYQRSAVGFFVVSVVLVFVFWGFLAIHGSAVVASVGGFNYAFHVHAHIDTI